MGITVLSASTLIASKILKAGNRRLRKNKTCNKRKAGAAWDLTSDGEAAITQRGPHLYLYTVRSHDRTKSARSHCFAENPESETFSELSAL